MLMALIVQDQDGVRAVTKLDPALDRPDFRLSMGNRALDRSDESDSDDRSTLEVVIITVIRVVTEKEPQMLEDSLRFGSTTDEDSVQDRSKLLELPRKLPLSRLEEDESINVELSGIRLSPEAGSYIVAPADVHDLSRYIDELSVGTCELKKSAIDRLDERSLDGRRAECPSRDESKMLVASETPAVPETEEDWSVKLGLCCCEAVSEASALDKVPEG